jgi:hypothetical protein
MTFGFAKLFFRAPNQRTKIAMNPIQSELLVIELTDATARVTLKPTRPEGSCV